MAALLMSSSANYCSGNNESVNRSLLDHPHFFRNALPAAAFVNTSLRVCCGSFYEPRLVFKTGRSVGGLLTVVSSWLTFKVVSLAVLGDCIDVERARSKRIEDMLKSK